MEKQLSHDARRGFTLLELIIVIVIIGALLAIVLPSLMSGRKTADCVRDVANAKTELQNLIVDAPSLSKAEMAQRLANARKRLNELQTTCCEKAKADLSTTLAQAIQSVDAWLAEHSGELTPQEKTQLDADKLTPITGC